jgi:hypothetical protein
MMLGSLRDGDPRGAMALTMAIGALLMCEHEFALSDLLHGGMGLNGTGESRAARTAQPAAPLGQEPQRHSAGLR